MATTERPTSNSAVVTFSPTPQQQRDLAADGIKGQLIVEYDVDRAARPGEVLVRCQCIHFYRNYGSLLTQVSVCVFITANKKVQLES